VRGILPGAFGKARRASPRAVLQGDSIFGGCRLRLWRGGVLASPKPTAEKPLPTPPPGKRGVEGRRPRHPQAYRREAVTERTDHPTPSLSPAGRLVVGSQRRLRRSAGRTDSWLVLAPRRPCVLLRRRESYFPGRKRRPTAWFSTRRTGGRARRGAPRAIDSPSSGGPCVQQILGGSPWQMQLRSGNGSHAKTEEGISPRWVYREVTYGPTPRRRPPPRRVLQYRSVVKPIYQPTVRGLPGRPHA